MSQIRDASSADPEAKLRADLEYIRRQSLSFDVKIVLRQIWNVWTDVVGPLDQSDEDVEPAVEAADEANAGEEDPEQERVFGKVQN